MQAGRWTQDAAFHLKKIVLAAVLASSLAGCGPFKSDPDAETAREVERLLAFEAYGGAAFEIAENKIVVTAAGEAEAGILLRASERSVKPIVVRFAYRDTAPLNLRLTRGDAHSYYSAASETFLLLGHGHSSEALFYGAGPMDFEIEVEDISACGADNYVCTSDSRVHHTFGGAGLKNRLLISTYGNARLDQAGKRSATIVRNSSQGEFGLMLTFAPEEGAEDYVLEFEVDKPEQVQLRVERRGQFRYHAATRGWARINDFTEILLFSGGAVDFEIRNVKLVDCATGEWRCRTAEDFAELLPGNPDDISVDRLISLTEWVTRNADYAASEAVAKSIDFTGLTPSQMYYKYYEPSIGGGYCSATAVFLAGTLRSEGFETFTIDFGLRDGDLTHVTTIVAVGDEFYMMDATFGAYFAIPGTNNPIDLFEVLDGAAYDFRTLDMSGRDFIVAADDRERLARMQELNLVENCKPSKERPVVVCNRPEFGLNAYFESFAVPLRENNLESTPQTLIELLKRGVFSIGANEDTDAMRRFARELDVRGIELVETTGQPSPNRLLEISEH